MKIETFLDYQTILANQARPVHFAIKFEADSKILPRAKPAAFCLVIDRSSSMAGEPLKGAKEAAKLAVRNLRPEDQFGLVVFDSDAQTLIPLQPAANKEPWLRLIDDVFHAGSTNLAGGWMLGRDELKKAPQDASRRLLLLSDGYLNVGIKDPPIVRQLVTAGLETDRVRTSCLGFGDGYNEDLMVDLARATGGQFYDADSPEKLPTIFAAELEGLQKLSVQNLRVRFRRLDFCDAAELLGNYPIVQLADGRIEIALGDLVNGEVRVLCFALSVLPLPFLEGKPAFRERLVEVEFAFDEIGESEVNSKTISQVIRIQATQNSDDVKIHEEIVPWVAMQTAGRVFEQVTKQMDAGKNADGIKMLEQAVEQIKAYGPPDQVAESVAQLERLLQKIRQGAWSIRERKNVKYRTASLGKMSSVDVWSGSGQAPSFKSPRRHSSHPPGPSDIDNAPSGGPTGSSHKPA